MKPTKNAMVGLGALALLLVGISLLLSSRAPQGELEEALAPQTETTASSVTAAPVKSQPMAGAPALQAKADVKLDEKAPDHVSTECTACREATCTNYKSLGYDVLNGCFDRVDPTEGADERDGSFNSDCVAVVRCATQNRCAYSAAGPLGCYCGSATVDDCIEQGPAKDGPCTQEWLRAARTSDHQELMKRWSDLKYPTGWANMLIECDRDDCKAKCAT